MSEITAEISTRINDNLTFDLFNKSQIHQNSESGKLQLVQFIQKQNTHVIQRWLDSLTLIQCVQVYRCLAEAEKLLVIGLIPARFMTDLERINDEAHPVIAVASTAEYLHFTADTRVDEAISQLQRSSDKFDKQIAFITDEQGCYQAMLELHQLLILSDDELLEGIAEHVTPCHVSTDREEAVSSLQHSRHDYVPLVDQWGRPVSVINAKQAMSVLQQEQTQDVEMLMGIQGAHDNTPYLETSVFEHVHKRIYWILGLAAVGILSGMVIQSYDDAIMALTILALYMPMVADTGGNAGSQASTVIVRSMALGELKLKNWCDVLWKELRVSLFIGLGLAAVSFAKVLFLSQGTTLPESITLTMLGSAIALALFFRS